MLVSGSTTQKLSRSAVLTTEQEAGLVRRIMHLANIGISMTSKMLQVQAVSFCKIKQILNTFIVAKNAVGKKFFKRHSELPHRKAQIMNPAHAQNLNEDIVDNHFLKYKSVLDRLGIDHKPEYIYNINEKKLSHMFAPSAGSSYS